MLHIEDNLNSKDISSNRSSIFNKFHPILSMSGRAIKPDLDLHKIPQILELLEHIEQKSMVEKKKKEQSVKK